MEKSYPLHVENTLRYSFCPVCSSNNIKEIGVIAYTSPILYSTKEISLSHSPQLWLCENCKSWFSQNIVKEEDSKQLYSDGHSGERWGNGAFEDIRSKSIFNVLNLFLVPDKQILDVGCGSGLLLDYAKSKGCKTSGVEYSLSACTICRENEHTVFSSLENVNQKYDIITAFDLVEHLYDFPAFINKCKQLLNPDGILIILTGDNSYYEAQRDKNNWWYVKFPEHIVFPSRKIYSLLGLQELLYKRIDPFLTKKITIAEIVRKIIRLFSKTYTSFPFHEHHYIIVLKNILPET